MDKKRRKVCLERNGGQEAEIAALKEKLVQMEAELKMNKADKEDLVQRVTSLEQDLAKKEAQLNLNNKEKEDLVKQVTTLKQELENKEAKLKLKDVREECHIRNVIALDGKLNDTKTELKLVTAKLEQVTKENSYLKSKIEKKEERWTELLRENERFREYLQDLQSANINQEEKIQINLCHSDLISQIMKIEDDDASDINSLPNEMLLEIFGYLEQNQLGQIARVCRRWNALRMSPALWKKVDVKFHWSHKFQNTVTGCFVNMLPSCVTSIRLDYSSLDCTEQLNFEELCLKLQRRCPCLETLIFERVHLSDNLPSVISLCTEFLPGVKILVVRHSIFSD